ncbi:MAG: NADH-quinone oxidoreductase subunit NuoK [Firmicutes bacterium]|jgi:NADH dehydrogenase subunit K (EC 1.6.5.3)|nr:NADH-quinone oxidoreductase subunit NuoK [Bacillota bacterium]
MEAIPVSWYLMLSAFMFAMGVTGVVIRRNPIVIFMCIELMLNAANLAFLAFARQQAQLGAQVAGQVYTILVMAVAAAEVAIGLGIIVAIYRLRDTINVDEMNLLKF